MLHDLIDKYKINIKKKKCPPLNGKGSVLKKEKKIEERTHGPSKEKDIYNLNNSVNGKGSFVLFCLFAFFFFG